MCEVLLSPFLVSHTEALSGRGANDSTHIVDRDFGNSERSVAMNGEISGLKWTCSCLASVFTSSNQNFK